MYRITIFGLFSWVMKMGKNLSFFKGATLLLIVFSLVQSCVLDEFNVSEIEVINMKDNWGMDVVSPLFNAKFKFGELIYRPEKQSRALAGETYSMASPTGIKTVPASYIFAPNTIIDSLHFLISGNYSLNDIELRFFVTNGSPFPFNIKMRVFNDEVENSYGPAIQPSYFEAGVKSENGYVSKETMHPVKLNYGQEESFTNGNRIEFTTWFDPSSTFTNQQVLSSNYPVEITVVLYGVVKRLNE